MVWPTDRCAVSASGTMIAFVTDRAILCWRGIVEAESTVGASRLLVRCRDKTRLCSRQYRDLQLRMRSIVQRTTPTNRRTVLRSLENVLEVGSWCWCVRFRDPDAVACMLKEFGWTRTKHGSTLWRLLTTLRWESQYKI